MAHQRRPDVVGGSRRRVRRTRPRLRRMSIVALTRRLERRLGADALVRDATALRAYECDGLTSHREIPALVVLPETTEQVAEAVRLCAEARVPFVARGAGTG